MYWDQVQCSGGEFYLILITDLEAAAGGLVYLSCEELEVLSKTYWQEPSESIQATANKIAN